ncbi:ABC transporter ATP-binding protein [Phaeocystidibacter marisrubri]|uniref:ABC transporter ATP-binding protein n=1 Tax=Phaeocystidibacter marisrubri TaxID=1577780 RepID=A0A6L3ZGC3_9FLAO|nr:ABC transporter ATP-binding protein [Phaeocystidibacter marisrubri]KAB2816404.1 ABC transporter ATP-binding protein [Phaeocystidibacter marisrubri]GGH68884.1 ABC transporter ATP-binding protein [Phaeocystidibacter marisrubri]
MLSIRNLNISFGETRVIHNLSFELKRGTTMALVGESGSGKSVTSLAVMGLLGPKAIIDADEMKLDDLDLLHLSPEEHRLIRGKRMAMIFQEPMTALNPSMRCGEQVCEMILQHESISKEEAKQRVIDLFTEVRIPEPEAKYNAWPHEMSGGQRQRVMIAMALSCSPELLIADEPTTALDVTVQGEILRLIKELQVNRNMAVLFITHDLGVVAQVADEVLVLFRGVVREFGPVQRVLKSPKDEYTKGLLECRPPLHTRPFRLTTVEDVLTNAEVDKHEVKSNFEEIESRSPLLEIQHLEKWFPLGKTTLFGTSEVYKAVNDVNVVLYPGETLGLVGESGCGKSTLSRCLVHLHEADAGQIFWKGRDITKLKGSALRSLRKEIQMIFQDPFASLNPRAKVLQILTEPMEVHGLNGNSNGRKAKAIALLKRVGLGEEALNKYPHEFSGGQRQRIGIARALSVEPELVICDESVSALDVSVQAQVLNLLNELKEEFGFTYLFISHDLSVVKYMSDHLMVMRRGVLEEYGHADDVYSNPSSAYTRKLIDSIPQID